MWSICGYSRLNSTQSPTSGTDNDSQPKLLLQAVTVHKVIGTYISVFLLPTFVCLRSKGNNVTDIDGPYIL